MEKDLLALQQQIALLAKAIEKLTYALCPNPNKQPKFTSAKHITEQVSAIRGDIERLSPQQRQQLPKPRLVSSQQPPSDQQPFLTEEQINQMTYEEKEAYWEKYLKHKKY